MQNPFPIYGYAPDVGANVAITMKNLTTEEEETVYSASDGSFIVDPANLPSQYNAELGDVIRITAPVSGYFAEVTVNVDLYPDGIEVTLTNPVKMISVLPSGIMNKFPTMGTKIPGTVTMGYGGLG